MSQQILFRNFELLEPSFGELRGGYELLVEGDTIKELSEEPIKAAEADGHRLRQAHVDAGADRLPRARHPQRGQCPLHGGDAADPGHRARGDAIARHARPRLHHRARHRRCRLGHQDRDRNRAYRRPTALYRRPVDRPHRRPFGFTPAHQRFGAATNASAATGCNSSPRSPMASTKSANPPASRCARAPTM